MNHIAPLFAAGDAELIKLIVVVVFFVVAGIVKMLAKVRQIPPPANRPNPPQPAVIDVAAEIEKFLRRAAGEKTEEAQEADLTEDVQPPSKPIERRAAAVVEQPRQEQEKPIGEQVGEHVKKYLDEKEFAARASHLGGEVTQSDEQFDNHLQQVFDHRVSKLEAVTGDAAAPPTAAEPLELVDATAAPATDLLDVVGNPELLRQAIILNEILHRPEERW